MRVKALRYLTWAGKAYNPGDVFDINPEDAGELLVDEVVEPADEEEEETA
jgi:hypothetical protein